MNKDQVLQTLRNIDAPKTDTNIVDAGLVHDVEVTDGEIRFGLSFDTDAPNLYSAIAMSAKVALKVAGFDGPVKIRTVTTSKQPSNGGGQPHKPKKAATGPVAPPPQAPKRGPGGLPVVGQNQPAAPQPPKRGPKGLPVVGAQGPPAPPTRQAQRVQQPQSAAMAKKPVPGVTNIIAVASGKGGVGKSTVASNLAAALVSLGYKVGLLDNDVYGPSAPVMLAIHDQPDVANKKLLPVEKYGLKVMSLGFLLDEGAPVIWRGPIVLQVTDQLFYDVDWGELDFLICDLPPGTGDVQLTMAQKVPVTGAVIVTTPQDVALADVERGLKMFQKVEVPVLGVVENMSTFVCPHCKEETPIFGTGGGKRKSKQLKIPFLGSIPIDPSVREWGDKGKPVVVSQPDSPVAKRFLELAEEVAKRVEGKSESGLARMTKRVLKIIQ